MRVGFSFYMIENSKLSIDVYVSVCACGCVVDWEPVQGDPCLHLTVAGMGSSNPVTLKGIQRVKKMDFYSKCTMIKRSSSKTIEPSFYIYLTVVFNFRILICILNLSFLHYKTGCICFH